MSLKNKKKIVKEGETDSTGNTEVVNDDNDLMLEERILNL